MPDWRSAAQLVKKIAENYKLPYYTLSPIYSICKSHGYISGEKFECPNCGEKTEVYSRITGYYRPVQNWNDGKLQEYKQREMYKIGTTHANNEDGSLQGKHIILFATKTCPNCRTAKNFLDKAKIQYDEVFADEDFEKAQKFGVRQAPTLIVVNEGEQESIVNVSNIRKYIESLPC